MSSAEVVLSHAKGVRYRKLLDEIRSLFQMRRLIVVGGGVLATFAWALWLIHYFAPTWPSSSRIFVDLHQRLFETGLLLHGQNPYFIGSHISDNVPTAVSVVHIPLYLAGHPAAELLSLWLSLIAMNVVVTASASVVFAYPRKWIFLACSALLSPILGFAILPASSVIVSGQDQAWFLALVTFDLLVISKRRSGVLVGLAAGLSVWPAVFVVLLLVRSGWRGGTRWLVGFFMAFAAGFALSPSATWHYWSSLVPSGRISSLSVNSYQSWPLSGYATTSNETLNGILSRAPLGGASATKLDWVLLALVVMTFGALVSIRLWRQGFEILSLLCMSTSVVESSPFGWTHHWIWVALFVPIAGVEAWRHNRIIGVLLFATCASFVRQLIRRAMALTAKHDGTVVLTDPYNFIVVNHHQIAGLVILGAASVLSFTSPNPGALSRDGIRTRETFNRSAANAPKT